MLREEKGDMGWELGDGGGGGGLGSSAEQGDHSWEDALYR